MISKKKVVFLLCFIRDARSIYSGGYFFVPIQMTIYAIKKDAVLHLLFIQI